MSESDSKDPLVLTRTLNASIEKVWEAWTNPEHIARWWGPHGFTNPRCEIDLREGGELRIDMTAPDGTVNPMRGIFREVEKPHKLVFLSRAFENENGEADLEVINTILLEEKEGKTLLTVEAHVQKAVGMATEAVKGQKQGWSETLDRLETLIQTI